MRFAVFGDIGGHYHPFVKALNKLEVDCDKFIVPDDLTIIQVGDLIDRGPDSDQVVEMVDGFLRQKNPQWIQLWGNHEGRLIGGPEFTDYKMLEWPTSKKMANTIQDWKRLGLAKIATGIYTEKVDSFLITHAGLSSWWYDKLCPDRTLRSTVVTLNSLPDHIAFSAGSMLGGSAFWGGPTWAECRSEVYLSWQIKETQIPFGQIHGHSSPYSFSKDKWIIDTSSFPESTRYIVRKKKRQTVVKIKSVPFIGIDPQLGKYDPYFDIEPYLLNGNLA
jgi:hypothetical protein